MFRYLPRVSSGQLKIVNGRLPSPSFKQFCRSFTFLVTMIPVNLPAPAIWLRGLVLNMEAKRGNGTMTII